MALSDYPTIMNGTTVPFFPEIKNKPQSIQNEHRAESGRRIVQVTRRDVMSIPVKVKVADYTWVQFFYQLSLLDSFTLKQYSPLVNGYSERTVSLEDFEYGAVRKSETLSAVTGVWEVSFTLEEF